MNVTLSLPFPGRGLSPNSRLHWRAKAAAVAEYRETCGWIAKAAMRAPDGKQGPLMPLQPPVRAEVVFVLPNHRRYDEDNLQASIKSGWDGMVDAGLLEDDRIGMLHIEGVQFVQGEKPGGVTVTLHGGE